jgi:hypothetical protein
MAVADGVVSLETTHLNTLKLSLLGASIRALIRWTILDWTMLGVGGCVHEACVVGGGEVIVCRGGIEELDGGFEGGCVGVLEGD